MQTVPLNPVPSQTLNITLNQQPCKINIYEKTTGMFCDLYVNGALIVGGVICQNLNRIVRDDYLGFEGDLAFYDTTSGGFDPISSGLGSRYLLVYFTAADVALLIP